MSTLHAAALVWPFLLVAGGLVIGRALRRADRKSGHEATGAPAESGPVPPEPREPQAVEAEAVPVAPQDDSGPEAADAPELPASR